jgi:Ca2+-binding RTX toxin-like protein
MFRRILIPLIAILLLAAPLGAVAQAHAPQGDWPPINGLTWVNKYDLSVTYHGTWLNDKLLGGHGNDVLYGHRGADVIWTDYKPTGNTPAQIDTVFAGGGNDWVYASHGRNAINAGAGNDRVRVWFGFGTVDCGPGRDILYVSHKTDPNVKRTNCEKVSHKSARDVANGG